MLPLLLEIICCPTCKADLIYDEKESTLTCTSCKTEYDVIDDLPILLPKNHGK